MLKLDRFKKKKVVSQKEKRIFQTGYHIIGRIRKILKNHKNITLDNTSKKYTNRVTGVLGGGYLITKPISNHHKKKRDLKYTNYHANIRGRCGKHTVNLKFYYRRLV